jgi:hypothetical protein
MMRSGKQRLANTRQISDKMRERGGRVIGLDLRSREEVTTNEFKNNREGKK